MRSCLFLLLVSVSLGQPARTGAQPPADTLTAVRRLNGQKRSAEALLLIEPFVRSHADSAIGWFALGNTHRLLGHLGPAAEALTKATTMPATAPQAAMALFSMYADSGRADDAFAWFNRMRGKIDLSSIAARSDLARLHDDPRFAGLFPDRIRFNPPFVEKDVRIIHEWRGERAGDEFGWIARPVGDVDGDKVTDVVISATANPPFGSTRGTVYLYSGRSGKLIWKTVGDSGSALGTGLEAAGDVNGDGVPDVVAGAPGLNKVLVLSGRDGKQLLVLLGDSAEVNLGSSSAGVGDIDGDGRPDILAGAPGSNHNGAGAGRAVIFSGRDGHRLLEIDGEHPGDAFGSTVGGAGGTWIIGAAGAGPRNAGLIRVYHGASRTPVFSREADDSGNALGAMFVSVIGDTDGDGIPDIYATDFTNGAKGRSTGRAYVYSGRTGAPVQTFTGDSAGEGFGIGAARVGDLDHDGRADLVIGSWQYSGVAWSGGRVRVFSGKDGHVMRTITGAVPGETLGFDAVGVGDVNGDGITDLLLTSAWSMVNGVRSGRVFIVAGEEVRTRTGTP